MINLQKTIRHSPREKCISRALAVFHGHFGRATVYQLNRPFNTPRIAKGISSSTSAARRAASTCLEQPRPLRRDTVVAVNPWEPHNFLPKDLADGAIFLRSLRQSRVVQRRVRGLRFGVRRLRARQPSTSNVRQAAAMICGAPSLDGLDRGVTQPDRRLSRRKLAAGGRVAGRSCRRRSHRLSRAEIDPAAGGRGRAEIELDAIAREGGAVAPAFLQAVPYPDRRYAAPLCQYVVDGKSAGLPGRHRGADCRYRLRAGLFVAERLHPLLRRQCRYGANGLSARRQGPEGLARPAGRAKAY